MPPLTLKLIAYAFYAAVITDPGIRNRLKGPSNNLGKLGEVIAITFDFPRDSINEKQVREIADIMQSLSESTETELEELFRTEVQACVIYP